MHNAALVLIALLHCFPPGCCTWEWTYCCPEWGELVVRLYYQVCPHVSATYFPFFTCSLRQQLADSHSSLAKHVKDHEVWLCIEAWARVACRRCYCVLASLIPRPSLTPVLITFSMQKIELNIILKCTCMTHCCNHIIAHQTDHFGDHRWASGCPCAENGKKSTYSCK